MPMTKAKRTTAANLGNLREFLVGVVAVVTALSLLLVLLFEAELENDPLASTKKWKEKTFFSSQVYVFFD